MQIKTNGKTFSLNHASVGTRFSGSYDPEEFELRSDEVEWMQTATPGECYPENGVIYLCRVD